MRPRWFPVESRTILVQSFRGRVEASDWGRPRSIRGWSKAIETNHPTVSVSRSNERTDGPDSHPVTGPHSLRVSIVRASWCNLTSRTSRDAPSAQYGPAARHPSRTATSAGGDFKHRRNRLESLLVFRFSTTPLAPVRSCLRGRCGERSNHRSVRGADRYSRRFWSSFPTVHNPCASRFVSGFARFNHDVGR